MNALSARRRALGSTSMKTHLSHIILDAVQRLVSLRPASGPRSEPSSTPDHVLRRLESVFEALSELSFQPDVVAAFDLSCDTLEAELPTAAVAAGLYDINCDEIRIVSARGLEHDL